jgi:hypothetical protein
MLTNTQQQVIVEKILKLPPDKVTEVEDFIDFLLERTCDKQLVTAATKLSETAFNKVWDNPDDAEYDQL